MCTQQNICASIDLSLQYWYILCMKEFFAMFKDKAYRAWLQIGLSILFVVIALTFCISSAINNNRTQRKATAEYKNVAQEHNQRVDELRQNDRLLKTPTYYIEQDPVGETGFKFTVLDVGQASCNLICCDGHYMIFDGGDRDTSSFVFSYMENTERVPYFDYVVASHYDSDHIAGLIGILKKFPVGRVLGAPYAADTKTYDSFYSAANTKGGLVYPDPGDEFMLGSAYCKVVSPVGLSYEDENSYSVGIRFVYGDTSFLVMGDATTETEHDSIEAGLIEPTDVLIVNHHGSWSSSSQEFIDAVDPQVAIISVGANNDYGHPAPEVLDRLAGIPLYRTDVYGTVTLISDGTNIDIYTEKEIQ